MRIPTGADRPDDHTPAVARHDAVHCCQSGLDDPSLRLSASCAEPFAKAIAAVSRDLDELTSIELLALTGLETSTVVVHGSRTAGHNTGWMAHGSSGPKKAVGGPQLAAVLEENLPGWYGLERGTLVLDPLGIAAAPTSRLVYVDALPSVSALESMVRSILQANHERSIPTVCQLLFRPVSTDEFRLTVRVAELSTKTRPLGRYGLTVSLETPPICPIDRLPSELITSSRRLADAHWEATRRMADSGQLPGLFTSDRSRPKDRLDARVRPSQTALTSLRLRDSTHEYAALLDGLEARGPYHALGVEPTVRLSADELQSILDVTPHYQPCRWPSSLNRRAPRFIRETVRTTAAGTAHEELLAGPQPTMTYAGGQDGSLWEFAQRWLRDVGCYSRAVDDRSLGEAHFEGHSNDVDGPVVLVDPNGETTSAIETAGELIMAANNAVDSNEHLLVVTPSYEVAEWARDVLEVPYASRLGPDVYRLYTIPQAVTTDSGAIVVSERELPPPYWSVSDGRRQSLWADDREVASGAITAPLSSYRFETPRAITCEESVAICNPDGTTRQTVPTLSACKTEYRFVRRPVVPIRPLFCAGVTVAYRDGSELIEPLRSQDWKDDSGLAPRERHFECALKTFVETYTFSATDGGETPAFFEQFLSWYDSHSTHKIPYGSMLTRLLSRQHTVRRDVRGNPAAIVGRRWWLSTGNLPLEIAHGTQGTE